MTERSYTLSEIDAMRAAIRKTVVSEFHKPDGRREFVTISIGPDGAVMETIKVDSKYVGGTGGSGGKLMPKMVRGVSGYWTKGGEFQCGGGAGGKVIFDYGRLDEISEAVEKRLRAHMEAGLGLEDLMGKEGDAS